MSPARQNCRQRTLQANTEGNSSPLQTNTDINKTLSELEVSENINSITNNQELVDYWFEENTNNSLSIATLDPDEESIAADVEQLNENNRSNIEAELIEADRAVEILPSCSGADSNRVANWLPPGPWSINWPLLMAAVVIATIPVILLFLIGQRQFIQGIGSTGIKN